MLQQKTTQFVIFGNTLAASMTVLALSKALPKNIKLKWLRPTEPCASDVLYGGITSPEAYQFNLQYGVTEPELILNTDSTFTFGSNFKNWGNDNRTWMQCFHLPFAATSGVELQHFMTRHNAALGDFLISAQAAIKGTFAHPPDDKPQSPLSRAEYGYHFDQHNGLLFFTTKWIKHELRSSMMILLRSNITKLILTLCNSMMALSFRQIYTLTVAGQVANYRHSLAMILYVNALCT